MKNWIIMVISYIIMIIVNALGSTGNINNLSQADISDRLNVLFTPDGYIFSIWGLIYLLIAIWLFIQYKRIDTPQELPSSTSYLFVATCIFNILWLLSWHYEIFVVAQVMMFVLLFNLLFIYTKYPKNDKSFGGRLPFSFYTGWISVATIANMSYTLKFYDISLGVSEVNGTIGLLIIAAALAIATLYLREDFFFALVFVWAIIGIGTVNTATSLVTTAYIIAVIIAIACVAMYFMKFKQIT